MVILPRGLPIEVLPFRMSFSTLWHCIRDSKGSDDLLDELTADGIQLWFGLLKWEYMWL